MAGVDPVSRRTNNLSSLEVMFVVFHFFVLESQVHSQVLLYNRTDAMTTIKLATCHGQSPDAVCLLLLGTLLGYYCNVMLSVYFVAAAYVERAWFGYKYLILFLQSFPHPFLPSRSEAKGTFLDVVSDYNESCLL